MRIAIACDREGKKLREEVFSLLNQEENSYTDFGCFDETVEGMSFVDITGRVCNAILTGEADRAIFFSGGGLIPVIACNKRPGIRAAIIHDVSTAHVAVEHDHVQVMCLGGNIIGKWAAADLIETFLKAKGNEDERTYGVLKKLENIEKEYQKGEM